MEHSVYRVLALGESEVLDRVTACLADEGYAVAHVDGHDHARRLLKTGDFDVVVADGASRAVAGLLSGDRTGRPWILLGRADRPRAAPDHALWLTPAVSKEELCRQIETVVARSREAETGTPRRPREKAASATRASRTAT
jgi:hypothetical protein